MITEKNDKLDYLLYLPVNVTEDRDIELFDSLDDTEVSFDKRFIKTRNRIIKQSRRKPFMMHFRAVMSRVAMFILVILSAGFIAVMSISSFRNAIWQIIVNWYDDYIAVHYDVGGNDPSESDSDVETGNNVVGPVQSTINEYRKPAYIPAGTAEKIVLKTNRELFIDYNIGDEWVCSYRQSVLDNEEIRVDNLGVVIKELKVNGHPANIFEANGNEEIVLIWHDGEYFYSLFSTDEELLIAMAESIK